MDERDGAAAPDTGPPASATPPSSPPAHSSPSAASSGDELAGELEAELGRATPASGDAFDDGRRGGAETTKKRGREEEGAQPKQPPAGPPAVCPPHPGSMGGICVRCGRPVPADEVEGSVALRYIHGGLRLHAEEAARVRAAATSASTAGRRLHLVLDLDHTLLNSTRLDEVPPALRPKLDAAFQWEDDAVAAAMAKEEGATRDGGRVLKKARDGSADADAGAGGSGGGGGSGSVPPPRPVDPRLRPAGSSAGPPSSAPAPAAPAVADPRRRGGAATTSTSTTSTRPPPPPTDPRLRPAVPRPPPPPPPHPLRTLFSLPDIGLITKLRPGLRAFLASAHERYELVVYTHGDRAYANAMARLLDPDGTLFGGRVISQNDSTVSHAKSLDVVLGQEKATLILDDTAGVWPGHAANLILVDRYIYFPACAGRFGTGRPSLLESGRDEVPARGTLASVGRVLDAVHARVFAGGGTPAAADAAAAAAAPAPPSTDVRVHLAAERAAVLAGCVLVLSGCAPIGVDAATSPVGCAATSLGARVEPAVVAGVTTHVVAAVDGTAKAAAGRAAGAAVVGPDWVWSASYLWRRAPEAAFPPPLPAAAGGGAGGGRGGAPPGVGQQRTEAEDVAAAAAAAGGGRRGGGDGGGGGGRASDDSGVHIDGVL